MDPNDKFVFVFMRFLFLSGVDLPELLLLLIMNGICLLSLHFNPRLDSGHIVMNTFEGGAWRQEDKLPLILILGQFYPS